MKKEELITENDYHITHKIDHAKDQSDKKKHKFSRSKVPETTVVIEDDIAGKTKKRHAHGTHTRRR